MAWTVAACAAGPRGTAPEAGPGVGTDDPHPSRVIQPGAPGEPSRELTGAAAADLPRPGHTEADVRFMRDMIHHHAQALEMTALVPDRTAREDLRLLARRIEISQHSEIELMRRWLEDRGEEAPDPLGHIHHGHAEHGGHAAMPGMLSPAQMASLREASGETFERLFLELMIIHHEGALEMVAELFASPRAAQSGDIFEFAAHVDADQRIEIGRMSRMLGALP